MRHRRLPILTQDLTLLTLVAVNATLAVVQQGPGARRQALLLALVLASGIAIRTAFALVAGAIVLWLVARPPSPPPLRTAGLGGAVPAIRGRDSPAGRVGRADGWGGWDSIREEAGCCPLNSIGTWRTSQRWKGLPMASLT